MLGSAMGSAKNLDNCIGESGNKHLTDDPEEHIVNESLLYFLMDQTIL
jgi:hypothetical protein